VEKKLVLSRILLAVFVGLLLVAIAFGSGYIAAAMRSRPFTGPALVPLLEDALSGNGSQNASVDNDLSLFVEAQRLVEQDFYGSLPSPRDRVYGAIRGLLETLNDPYTVFVEPVPRQFEQDDLRGSYGGLGMGLSRNEQGQIVLSPFRDSPAAEAGITEGDILIEVDGVAITSEMDVSQDITARVRGEVGTQVTLVVQRGDEVLTFRVTRQVIKTPSVTWRVLEGAPTLGYVQITSFTDRTPDELRQGLLELQSNDLKGLVLDLRNNGGGLLQSSIDVADQFLDGGVVLYEMRRGQDEIHYLANAGGPALNIPLVVLVNHATASASEIVAGAIQDRERGVLLGEPTFGKGSVQLIFDLRDGSSLHVTAARWYTPDHHQLDGVGLTPDVAVTLDQSTEADTQVRAAIDYLQSGSN
jgi:carboxyl-terminal processing protease